MSFTPRWLMGLLLFVLAACGPKTGQDNHQKDGSHTPRPGEGSFALRGSLASAEPLLGESDGQLQQGLEADVAARATHVLAVSTGSFPSRVVAQIQDDRSFELGVDPAQPWILVFVDATKTGAEMVLASFRAQSLDSLAPSAEVAAQAEAAGEVGGVDLGSVTLSGGAATSSTPFDGLLAQLGMSVQAAEFLGATDDVSLRYVNPDIDGDGTIDALQEHRDFGLDFHVQMSMSLAGGQRAKMTDILGQFLPEDAGIEYGGTGMYLSYPEAYESADPASGSVEFEQELHYEVFAQVGGGSFVGSGGVALSGEALIVNNFGDMRGFGVFAQRGHDMPQGKYTFRVGQRTLTFTNVETRSDAQLSAAEQFIVPFIKFVPQDPACTESCALASVDFAWRVRTETGWREATLEELQLVVADQGGFISLRPGSASATAGIGMTLPLSSTSGSLAWTAENARLSGISEAEFLALTSDKLCHLGLSYDDKLGMRYFAGIDNADGTCQ